MAIPWTANKVWILKIANILSGYTTSNPSKRPGVDPYYLPCQQEVHYTWEKLKSNENMLTIVQ